MLTSRQSIFAFLIALSPLLVQQDVLAAGPTTRPADALAHLAELKGSWQQIGEPKNTLTCRPISGDSAVEETLAEHGNMVTIYHMDGDNLVLTHYCAAGNQPQMKAKEFDDKHISFTFTGGANIPTRDTGHMDSLVIRFIDKDHISQTWTWYEDGKEGFSSAMDFERVKESKK